MGFGREISPEEGRILTRSMDTTHTCPHCHVTKPTGDFYPDRSKTRGHSSWCKTCSGTRQRARDRSKARTHDRTYRLRKKYGLSHAEFDAMMARQDHRCAICREVLTGDDPYPGLVMDQGGDRGVLRSLLCQQCHVGIACFEANPGLLESALRYVLDVCGA